jgi:hypothetical protein
LVKIFIIKKALKAYSFSQDWEESKVKMIQSHQELTNSIGKAPNYNQKKQS